MSNKIQIDCSSIWYAPISGSGDGPLGGLQGLGKYLDFTGKVAPFPVRPPRRTAGQCTQFEIEDILASDIRAPRPTVRTAIEMQQLEELSICETAEKMGISVAATKSRLHHGNVQSRIAIQRRARGYWEQTTVELIFLDGSCVPFADRASCGLFLAAQKRRTEYGWAGRAPASDSHRDRYRVFLKAGPKCR